VPAFRRFCRPNGQLPAAFSTRENAASRKLRSILAGTYRIKIEDKASIHNFRLRGLESIEPRPSRNGRSRSGR